MYRTCSKCGKLHKYGYICKAGIIKDYSKYSYEESKLRNTYEWHTKAGEIKTRSNYLCAICLENGIYNYNDLEVHHIIKIKEDKTKLLDDYNLICLCKNCHKLADSGLISKDKLFALAKAREDKLSQ